MNRKEPTKSSSKQNIPAISLGLNMAAGMAVFSGLGYYIDQKRGVGMEFTLSGMFLGLFYCGYEVWKLTRRDNQEDENN